MLFPYFPRNGLRSFVAAGQTGMKDPIQLLRADFLTL